MTVRWQGREMGAILTTNHPLSRYGRRVIVLETGEALLDPRDTSALVVLDATDEERWAMDEEGYRGRRRVAHLSR